MPVSPGKPFGRYEIRSLLGAGGMGKVYLALDTGLRRLVALKLLVSDSKLDKEQLLRFAQEARAVSALNHPNILTIYEIGEADRIQFIVTEFIDGMTLRQRLHGTRMELREALDVALQIASALAAAHQAGIVHRDIKPENIMVRPDGYIKVLDFGLAKLNELQTSKPDPRAKTVEVIKTEPGVIMGTTKHMSPEQARGIEVDQRTDLWSLGVVLFEMITGKAPFIGPTKSDVIASILKTDPFPLSRFAKNVPEELERIVKKSLKKGRKERYQTAKDLIIDLKDLLSQLEKGHKTDSQQSASSVAILPFRNLTNDPTVSFYEFSLADAVITELVRLRSLVVRPSSAIAKYMGQFHDPFEAGGELKVGAVLTASFLHANSRVRVTAQLLNVSTGEVLWGDRIDSEASDIITVQDKIAQRIVEGLHLRLGSDERINLAAHATANVEAYEEYLRGRDRVGKYIYHTVANEDIEAAMAHFRRAIEFDADFALAHCALGGCHIQRVLKGAGSFDDLARAREAFDRGLTIDPLIVEARIYMVYVFLFQGDKQKARTQIADLRAEMPNNSRVHFVSGVMYRLDGDYDKALLSLDRSVRLNPAERLAASWTRARIFMYQGRYNEALRELDQGAAIEPEHPLVSTFRAQVLTLRGEPEAGAKLLEETLANHAELEGIRPLLALALSRLGKHDEARAQLTDRVKEVALFDHDVPYWLASAYAMEGIDGEAFRWLEKAISLGNENLPWFRSDPAWQVWHNDPRFTVIMRKLESDH